MSLQSPEMTITVEMRDGRGSAEAGRMRHLGRVPAVVYGGDKPPVAIRQLIPDYFAHMENHERQARRIISG